MSALAPPLTLCRLLPFAVPLLTLDMPPRPAGVGDINKHLSLLGAKLLHKQTALHEFNFAVDALSTDLRDGVRLGDGIAKPKSARVIEDQNERTLLEVVMTEGRKHEVRRMIDKVGLNLERLARTAYGGVEIGDLKQGKYRHLSQTEVSALYAAVGEGDNPPPSRHTSLHERRARQAGRQ